MNNVLKLTDMTMKFGGITAIDGLNLKVDEGQIVSIIGPNGAGKTTAFNCITGIYIPTSGNVEFYDESLLKKNPDYITKKGIARTFQNIRLFKELNVYDNVNIAMHLRYNDNIFSSTFRANYKMVKEMAEETKKLLESQDLYKYRTEKASSLPYGIQRRLEIARALATRPKLLLLDEPAAGMNPQETVELTKYINEIKEKYSLSILLIEHHMDLVMDISDRIYVLNFGKLIAEGNKDEIQNNPVVIKAYLGEEKNA